MGLIGEEVGSEFKTYHFDFRGSTVAITDANGNITDTFSYDTYGKLISRTGTSNVIFGYNGRDGVVTESNGLIYMRARYYSPEMRRFINADIIPGEISNAITLNRFAYANGNPVSFVDPFGLSILVTLAVMAIGGLVVAAVNTVESIGEQTINNGEVNWKEVLVDATWGFVDGAISFSPLGAGWQIVGQIMVSAGNEITDAYFDSDNTENGEWFKEINWVEVGGSVAIDAAFAVYGHRFEIENVSDPKKLFKFKNYDGFYKPIAFLEKKIVREKRRANDVIGGKRALQAKEGLWDYAIFNTIQEAVPGREEVVKQGVKEIKSQILDNRK